MKISTLAVKLDVMNEIPYITNLSDNAILIEIGKFITQRRIQLQITQAELADKAALSRSTVSLMERGESISLNNLLKILRVLDALYVLSPFRVQEKKSPLALAREEQKKYRKRVVKSHKNTSDEEDLGW